MQDCCYKQSCIRFVSVNVSFFSSFPIGEIWVGLPGSYRFLIGSPVCHVFMCSRLVAGGVVGCGQRYRKPIT